MRQATAKLRRRINFLLPVCGCIFFLLSASAQTYHMMSWEEYLRNSNSYRWPYLLNIYMPHGSLFYFGANHSKDPLDGQFAEIDALWKQYQPEFAFNEGGNPPVKGKTRNEAIKEYGEAGLVRYLAARDKIPVKSMDPDTDEEVAELGKKFSPGQLKIFFILRQMPDYDRMREPKISRDEYLQKFIAGLSQVPRLNVPPNSISELEPTFAKYFPGQASYKNEPEYGVDPAGTGTTLNEISRASTEFRDRFMVAQISQTVCEQKRVFAVVGASHVVMQEPAIRELLSQKCSH